MSSERFRPYFAVYLVFKKEDKILLLKRQNTGYMDGNYSMVAGHVDEGESYLDAAIHEAKEEAGVDIEKQDLSLVFLNHNTEKDRTTVSVYLEVKKYSGEIYNAEPDKCADLSWFEMDKLPENLTPHVRYAIEKMNLGINFGEFGFGN
jgi:ADP-ribose pyrophosphatase YjhB (NUDIX family)